MDGSPCGLLLGLLGYQSPRLSLSSVIMRFSVYISIHFREKLASNGKVHYVLHLPQSASSANFSFSYQDWN